MVQPFADFDEFAEQEEAKREGNYARKILKLVLTTLVPNEATKLRYEAGDEFGFRWANANCDWGISLDAANLTVRLPDLLKRIGVTKTPLWQRYWDLHGEYGSPFGLIFPLPGLSQWIMHDCGDWGLEENAAHIVRVATKRNARLIMSPLASFLQMMLRHG
jgi:hypothetical protein